jgi:hypothetical protein
MLEAIVLAVLKTIATTVVKYYVTSLLAGGRISYDAAELGYRIPGWYMDPGKPEKTLYAYGTSVEGDEFASIEDARREAIGQMARHIRLGNRKLVDENVHYDASSVKQKRLIELFVRADGLEDFIRANAVVDRKKLVRVKGPPPDMRAFVRLALDAGQYVDYQRTVLEDLRRRLTQQKAEDIMAEMDAELKAWEAEEQAAPAAAGAPAPEAMWPAVAPETAPVPPPVPPPPADGAFADLEAELNQSAP